MRLIRRNQRKTLANNVFSYGLLLAIVLTTMFSLASSHGWNIYLDIAANFQVQYVAISFFLFLLLALMQRKEIILVGLACVIINMAGVFYWYIPQSILGKDTTEHLRVLLLNINTKNDIYSKVISLVREEQPDIAVFLELNSSWIEQLKAITDILPYPIGRINTENLDIAVAVYSKSFLLHPILDDLGSKKNAILLGDLTINKQLFSFVATDTLPALTPALFEERNQQLEKISQYVQQLKNPVVLVGDLNTTMWSPYYKKFVRESGLRNARQGFGILPTWPTSAKVSPIKPPLTLFLSIPIDHCLISPRIKVVNIRTGPNVGSDHRPLIADLVISDQA